MDCRIPEYCSVVFPRLRDFFLALLALIIQTTSSRVAQADILLTSGHVDFVVEFNGSAWTSYFEDEFGQVDLSQGIIYAPSSSTVSRPTSPNFDFLGVNAGDSVWVLPAIPRSDLVWLGISTRTIGLQSSQPTQLRLSSVVGPGSVSLWSNGAFGTPTPHWSSFNGLSESDTLTLSNNTHAHLNWAMSQPGDYTLLVDVSGVLANGLPTPVGSFVFQVQAVPEPASLSLGVMAIATLATRQICRRKTTAKTKSRVGCV